MTFQLKATKEYSAVVLLLFAWSFKSKILSSTLLCASCFWWLYYPVFHRLFGERKSQSMIWFPSACDLVCPVLCFSNSFRFWQIYQLFHLQPDYIYSISYISLPLAHNSLRVAEKIRLKYSNYLNTKYKTDSSRWWLSIF